MKFPRHCPFVLLVKLGWKAGKTFVSEGRDEKTNKERSGEGANCIEAQACVNNI
jgi:hypothetical protein